jgi:hypothetical protein
MKNYDLTLKKQAKSLRKLTDIVCILIGAFIGLIIFIFSNIPFARADTFGNPDLENAVMMDKMEPDIIRGICLYTGPCYNAVNYLRFNYDTPICGVSFFISKSSGGWATESQIFISASTTPDWDNYPPESIYASSSFSNDVISDTPSLRYVAFPRCVDIPANVTTSIWLIANGDYYSHGALTYSGKTSYWGYLKDTGFGFNNIPFAVALWGSYGMPIPGYTAPSSSLYGLTSTSSATGQDLGFFGNMIRDVIAFLFKPNQSIVNDFNNEVSTLQTKVPWGYWNQLSVAFASVSSTDITTSTPIALKIQYNGTTETVPIIDMTAIQDKIPPNLLELIRALGAVALWALFGTWIWHLVTGNKPEDHGEV